MPVQRPSLRDHASDMAAAKRSPLPLDHPAAVDAPVAHQDLPEDVRRQKRPQRDPAVKGLLAFHDVPAEHPCHLPSRARSQPSGADRAHQRGAVAKDREMAVTLGMAASRSWCKLARKQDGAIRFPSTIKGIKLPDSVAHRAAIERRAA
ncbi:hypothetical protein [Rhodobaculum claviforme]|uniref:Uncharacterized protein n=1 Tax=Rhodobaculum claviforme TaxID=1549854 RepID=A0A934TLP7_9RHOB|nr:hypothetical protein [Rhodobaculum claviforme]MBK5927849.1 hypothetical protein [Rhodobaculum claviforme]